MKPVGSLFYNGMIVPLKLIRSKQLQTIALIFTIFEFQASIRVSEKSFHSIIIFSLVINKKIIEFKT